MWRYDNMTCDELCHVQIKFDLVSEDELETQRKQFRNGELQIKIEHEEFNMRCACHPRATPWCGL